MSLQLRSIGPQRVDLVPIQIVPEPSQITTVALDCVLRQTTLSNQRVEPGVQLAAITLRASLFRHGLALRSDGLSLLGFTSTGMESVDR